jgi:GT2 family glycosyltransferase
MSDRNIPTIDVIVVTFNHKRFMRPLFEGLAKTDYPVNSWNAHFVDNGSTDGTTEEIKALIEELGPSLPETVLIESKENLGFAGGNNLVMRASKADYVYLLNPDAIFEPSALSEIVKVAEEQQDAGAFQSLQVLAQDTSRIASAGNDIVFTGHGYCRGYKDPVSYAPKDVTQIAYASGASVLYCTEALKEAGYFDETLFAYHEDLDLGWRMNIAGIKSLLVPSSVVRHHFEFSRSIKKWYWMERNRIIVIYTLYRLPTILLLLPAILIVDLVTWLTAIAKGWGIEKLKADVWFFNPKHWIYLFKKRRQVQKTRKMSDREILKLFVPTIEHQEIESWFMRSVAKPLMKLYFTAVKRLIFW